MLATIPRQTAIQQLDIEHAAVQELINILTEAEMTRPDTIKYGLYWDQHLSFKDLLAHLITYEALAIEAIEAWQRGQQHTAVDEMQSDEGSRRIHYGGIEDRRSLVLAAVLQEWEQTQARLMDKLHRLSDVEWHTKAPFYSPVLTDLGGILEVILVAPPRPPYRHLPVHIPDVQAYIRSFSLKKP
jgi:hypothetical protein